MNDGGRIRPDSLAGTSLDPDLVIDFDLNKWPVVEAVAGRPSPNERRALHALLRYREPGVSPYRRITPAMRADLLGWAATLSDEELLDMRNVGKTLLRWIREHQPVVTQTETTLAWLMKSYGWRVELFWNTGGVWFTARLVDREGNLMPQDDPIGVSAQSPGQALADLHDAVLECSPGHVHDGEWCALCVEHGRAAVIIDGEAT